MSIEATRIQKTEVEVSFPAVEVSSVSNEGSGKGRTVAATLRERDARDLMHALGSALGYDWTPKVAS